MRSLFITISIFLFSTTVFSLEKMPISKSDQLIDFVKDWFTLFDTNQETQEFQKRMVEKDLYIKFPEAILQSYADFDKWYDNVRKTFRDPSHDVREISVGEALNGSYIVNLVVIWKATETKTENQIRFEARQLWEVVEDNNTFKIKKYYVQANNQFFNPISAYVKHLKIPAFGGFVIENGSVIESMAMPGLLDFMWIEAEHSTLDEGDVQDITRTVENENLNAFVRVPKNDIDVIKRYIGTGVKGVIVPSIKTGKDAKDAVNATKYAPLGNRPAGVERGNRYLGLFAEYKGVANDEVLLVVMIETKEAVSNIEDIVKVKGIDILHMGPYDLSLSMGVSMDSDELKAAVGKVEKVAAKYNIPLGSYAPSREVALEKYQRGYRFFTIPDPMRLIRDGVNGFFAPTSP